MKHMFTLSSAALVLSAVLLASGCASDAAEKPSKPKKENRQTITQPSKVKFGEFKNVEIKPFGIAEKHANHEGNQKSARVMDELLQRDLKNFLPNLKVLAAGEEFSKPAERTLQITPFIENIRIVSTGSRVWLGAMAGGSDLQVSVTYRDSSTGEIIANPEFGTGISGWSDAWGSQGNKMRDEICREISFYTLSNK